MKLLRTITEKDLGRIEHPDAWASFRIRPSARAVLFDTSGRIALMHVTVDNYYELPGGGIDAGEDASVALKRELLEEAGASSIEIIDEIGQIDEYRELLSMKSEHYCFIAKLTGDIVDPERTQEEINEGYQTVWVENIDEAIDKVRSGQPKEYGHDFERLRELTFLEYIKNTGII